MSVEELNKLIRLRRQQRGKQQEQGQASGSAPPVQVLLRCRYVLHAQVPLPDPSAALTASSRRPFSDTELPPQVITCNPSEPEVAHVAGNIFRFDKVRINLFLSYCVPI